MDNKFSNDMASVFNFSREEAQRTECDNVSPEHLLLGMLRQNVSKTTRLMHEIQPDLLSLKRHLEKRVGERKVAVVPDKNAIEMNREATRLMRLSILEARAQHADEVDTEHLLKAMLKDQGSPIQQILEEHGLTRENLFGDVRNGYSHTNDEDDENENGSTDDGFELSGAADNDSPILTKKKTSKTGTPVLDNFCTDLTEKARKGELDPVVGREKEMERVAQILSRRKKNNPILIGEPGVGKSAIVEGLAQRIIERKVARQLWGKRVLTLDMAALVAGTKFRGQFEERVRNLLMELEKNPDIIIYIDEIHTIIGAGGSQGSMDAANMLKPALARGQMQCIGATTIDEFRKTIEKDGALDRRFQKIMVSPTTAEETLQILHRLKSAYEKHHKVQYTDEALEACVQLTQRYISDRAFPDKAIDAMDESGARMHISNIPTSTEMDKLEEELRSIEEDVPTSFAVASSKIYYNLFHQLIQLSNEKDVESRLLYSSKIAALLVNIQRDSRFYSGEGKSSVIYRAERFMTENFTDKIGLKEVAESVHLSPNYFHKLFTSVTGSTPHDFLMKKRLNYAKELIMTSDHDMMEISMLSGFGSQAYFNYCFKQATGLSPIKYREKEFEKYKV